MKQNEKEMIILAWKIKESTEIVDIGRQLYNEMKLLRDKIQSISPESEENFPSQLSSIRKRLAKGVIRHQRTAASHILVFMISTEDRTKKPYALPIQCVPYKGLSDSKVRDLANNIISDIW